MVYTPYRVGECTHKYSTQNMNLYSARECILSQFLLLIILHKMNEHSKSIDVLETFIEQVAFNIYKYYIDKNTNPVFDDESGEWYFKTIDDSFSVSVSHTLTTSKVQISTNGGIDLFIEIDDGCSTAKNFLFIMK